MLDKTECMYCGKEIIMGEMCDECRMQDLNSEDREYIG